MDPIENLARYFREFPGIGTRQAHRFVFHLLKRDGVYVREFMKAIEELRMHVASCPSCGRYFMRKHEHIATCSICADTARDSGELMVVEKDSDLDAIERSGAYRGRYFVLGGTLPILDKAPEKRIRIRELLALLKRQKTDIKEIILATAFTPESEHTADYVRSAIEEIAKEAGIRITTLGRGLSTGSELEYADAETLRFALEGRK